MSSKLTFRTLSLWRGAMPRPAVAGALLAAAMVAGFGLWRSGWIGLRPGDARANSAQESAAVFASMSTIDLRDTSAVRSALESGETKLDPAVTAPQMAALRTELADFIERRFVSASASEYRAWRLAKGYQLRPKQEMIETWFLADEYPLLFGQPMPEAATLEALHDGFIEAAGGLGEKRKVTRMANEREGVFLSFGKVSRQVPTRPGLDGKLTSAKWYGERALTLRPWWETKPSTTDLLKNRPLPFATVGMVVEFAGGQRATLISCWFLNPATDRWMLESLNVNNFLGDGPGSIDY